MKKASKNGVIQMIILLIILLDIKLWKNQKQIEQNEQKSKQDFYLGIESYFVSRF